ncbi:MAG: outer membrane lipoprotein-sorting protein [Burkholderia contaminans]|uniref:Outer membrane lipoprotein-sorting protein n=1 Tax=Burkholderia contaminans TaxID=488447 RepID=A0AAP4R0D2_9BURK|nr:MULTISPECIES: outer membrane lipoprotein-sorting protein [Burkholderia]MBD1417147.1 outer membrane lipoprotein-sorting protein [Burkholderia contaminans]MBH9670010.1 outer membrane lipoprotein-sorting protein [Burkholderia contaminans]MBH9676972.1 outer membrane lipoprotein-sorting protein [Burkholderia contaminans]MBH9707396.1 outer membrane lipoprotein-sorting protein [Burkholderia contaminans]MBH9720966.1 outer membrane lipoprotein-sorting protein [Burkholderia contaminans]
MRRLFVSCCLSLSFLAGVALAQPAPDPQKVLAASDAIRTPEKSFVLTATLIEYRSGKQVDGNTLSIYSKPDAPGGAFRTLVRFVAPARDTGKLMLKNGNDLWFYDPANQASVRISPDQRLLGQAANGDVVTVNLAHDYTAELKGIEDIADGDRQTRRAYRLALTGHGDGLTYRRIELWVDVASSRPLKARFYAESDRLLKTAFYRRYTMQLGVERPTETVIIDGLDSNWVTVMRFSDYAWRDIPDAWLQRDYLSRFQAQ